MPRISIIMGAYNCSQSIGRCVESIIKQSFTDWELIICDDCSKDTTREVIRSLMEQDKRIKLIENSENHGLAYSLNQCLQCAEGEYIARMDCDDIALADRFKQQVEYLDSHQSIDVVGGGVILYDESGDKKTILNPEFPDVKYMVSRIPFFHPTIMMRKKSYKKLGGYTVLPRTRRGQDMDLWFRFFSQGMIGANLQVPVIKYHDGLSDIKKKDSVKMAWHHTVTKLIGFKINRFPLVLYPYAFIPLVMSILPRKIVYLIHNARN